MPILMDIRPSRQTRQKEAVLRSLVDSGRSLAPAEILELARAEVPTLNLSTVYRQLRALHEEIADHGATARTSRSATSETKTSAR